MSTLHVLNGSQAGELFPLKEGVNYVGRSTDNDIWIQDETVSRKHLKILKKGEEYDLTDLSRRNGTLSAGNYLAPGLEVGVPEAQIHRLFWISTMKPESYAVLLITSKALDASRRSRSAGAPRSDD